MSASGRTGRDPVGWFVRLSWGRRLETGLTFATVVARVSLVALLGRSLGLLAVGRPLLDLRRLELLGEAGRQCATSGDEHRRDKRTVNHPA